MSAFADDTSITCTANTIEHLQQITNNDFKCIQNWLNTNLLSLNLEKTTYINFSNKRNPNDLSLKIKDIQQTDSTKYLGIIIDEKLKWECHIHHVVKKLRKTIYKFVQLRNVASKKLITAVYYALIQSQLIYGIASWGGAFLNTIEKLNVIQRKILKIIHKKPNRFPTVELFKLANVLTINQLFIKEAITTIHNKKRDLPAIEHNYDTRWTDTQPLRQNLAKLTLTQRQAPYTGIEHYNKLPIAIKNIKNPKSFRKKLNQWLKTEHTSK